MLPSILTLSASMSTTRTVDYDSFLSSSVTRRKPSPIRASLALAVQPGMINLAGGMPNASLFPFTDMQVTVAAADGGDVGGATIQLSPGELSTALQYSATPGLPALRKQLLDLQQSVHAPPLGVVDGSGSGNGEVHAAAADVHVTTGSQDALWKAFDTVIDDDDAVLVESPTYSGSLAYLTPKKCDLVGVATDADGLVPEALDALLQAGVGGGVGGRNKYKVLYTIPTGHNPTGASQTLARKQAVYALAQKYDLLILEDDPYYYLHYGRAAAAADSDPSTATPAPPAYLSMDTDGRVVRFDSLSKLISSGMRIGFVTGPRQILDKMSLITQATSLHPCGVSQTITSVLLRQWGVSGFHQHCERVATFYQRRRDAAVALVQRHLADAGLVTFDAPTGGMFIWMRLANGVDARALMETHGAAMKVVAIPGVAFDCDGAESDWLRLSFSLATAANLDAAVQNLAKCLTDESLNHKRVDV
jgi:kynurenine/2-aminoadipate aminotransferase